MYTLQPGRGRSNNAQNTRLSFREHACIRAGTHVAPSLRREFSAATSALCSHVAHNRRRAESMTNLIRAHRLGTQRCNDRTQHSEHKLDKHDIDHKNTHSSTDCRQQRTATSGSSKNLMCGGTDTSSSKTDDTRTSLVRRERRKARPSADSNKEPQN